MNAPRFPRFFRRAAVAAIVLGAALTAITFASGPSPPPRAPLDGALRSAIERNRTRGFTPDDRGHLVPVRRRRTAGPVRGAATDPTGSVQLFLTGQPDEARLRALGVRILTRTGDVITAEAPLSAAARLGGIPGLTRAFLARPMSPQLDVSIPVIRADSLRERTDGTWTGLTGENVIIGVVDSGLDVTHDDFLRPDGTTRVLYYWDQEDDGGPAPMSAAGDTLYGTEWTAAEIDAGPIRATDHVGHGTHVAGIAAGDGSASDTEEARWLHAGVAPNADLIIVDAVFLDTSILDAVAYVFERAAALGRPAVVNLSIGNQFGPHDGTTPLAKGLDELCGPGRIVTAAAGNEALDRIHAELHVPAGGSDSATVDVAPYVADDDFNFFTVDAFYDGPDEFSATVVTPGGLRLGPYLLGEEQADTLTGEGSVFLLHWDPDPTGPNLEVQLEVSDYNPDTPDTNGPPPTAGDWTLVFTDLNGIPAGGEVDLWLPFAFPIVPTWTDARYDPAEEITVPGTASRVVTVGSFNTKQCWPQVTGEVLCSLVPEGVDPSGVAPGPISYFSNRGPTRDGREKPDLVAPGFVISSSYGSQIDLEILASYPIHTILNPDHQHWVNAGTSMATAHVTGAVALWLENHPAAEPESVVARLALSAREDAFTGDTWNARAGHGKLDVAAFVDPGLVPVRLRAIAVTTVDGRAHLAWSAGEADPVTGFRLDSRVGSRSWRERAVFAGAGPHQWTDAESETPTDYRILARLREGGQELWSRASWSPRPRPAALVLDPAQPNPFRTATRIPFRVEGTAAPGRVRARVYDVRGRLVRELGETRMDGSGAGVVEWGGTDAAGRSVEAGFYWIHVDSAAGSATIKLVRLP